MNKKIALLIAAAFLLACNALMPATVTSVPETAVPPAIEPAEEEATPAPGNTPGNMQEGPAQDVISPEITIVRLRPGDGDLEKMLAEQAQQATALGQMPILEFDATWCPPCQVIDEGLHSNNELLLDAYAGTYIIKLDVDEWGWSDSSLHDFDFDGIPVYFKLDENGQPTGETIDGNAWGENIPENIAPPMDEFFHGE